MGLASLGYLTPPRYRPLSGRHVPPDLTSGVTSRAYSSSTVYS
jgi:hypothetical protein